MPQTCSRSSRAEVVEELDEAGDQVGLGEQHIDRDAHAELVLQLAHAAADGAGMGQPLVLVSCARSDRLMATSTPFSGWRRRCFLSRRRKPSQAALSTAAWLSCVV